MIDQIKEMINQAARGEGDAAADLLVDLAQKVDAIEMMAACFGIATIGSGALKILVPLPGPGMYAFERTPGSEGKEPDPGELFAMRFITSMANDDRDICTALYFAALRSPGAAYADAVCALLATTASLVRSAALRTEEGVTYPAPVCSGKPGRCEVHGRHKDEPKPGMDNLKLFEEE